MKPPTLRTLTFRQVTLCLSSFTLALILAASAPALASQVREYELIIAEGEVDLTGTPVQALTVNGGIPGPTLRFTEGDTARIHVHNRMPVETSVHWHGLLVPPEMDGVPYLNFPPIAPGTTFTYEFPIRQSGTYWYHSHSAMQEQRGVYGSIVITPKAGEVDASDRDHVVLLSDWTDTDPMEVLRSLRRGSEWFAVERGSGQSILGAARAGRLKDYFVRELQRMPAMDIADVAYDAFLANGRVESTLPASAGETVRLRLIDGSATTFFHVEFAGGPMTVISADGIDVEPFEIDRLLISVAETYDVLVRMPGPGAYELRATAHDASSYTSVWLGQGERHPAPDVPHPDLYENMMGLDAKLLFARTPAGSMGMPTSGVEAGLFDAPGMNMEDHAGMDHGAMGHGEMDHGAMDHGAMDHDQMEDGAMEDGAMEDGQVPHGHAGHGHAGHDHHGHDAPAPVDPATKDPSTNHAAMGHGHMDHAAMDHGHMDHATMDHAEVVPAEASVPQPERTGKPYGADFGWLATDIASREQRASDGTSTERPWAPYARLRARQPTAFDPERPVREIRLTLDGDMERYVWFLGGKPLSTRDDIKVYQGEVTRFILINRTMMHHPMHLHGHFFRVLNGQGDYSPLKHTVDVEPMSTTVIEFDANEFGDWFFHCHLLYHMDSGMARVVSYDGFVPPPESVVARSMIYHEHWFQWGQVDLMSHRSTGSLVTADTRNILTASWEVGWQDVERTEGEVTLTWDRYVNRFTTWFVGLDVEGDEDEVDDPRAVLGGRYLLPFSIESSVWVDSDGEVRVELEKAFHLTPRLGLDIEVEYDSAHEWEQSVRAAYTLSQQLDLLLEWHSENGLGGGLTLRF